MANDELLFQVDHLSSVTCEVTAVTPETLLADFIRKSSTESNEQSMICDINVRNREVFVIDKQSNQILESWSFKDIKSCRALSSQPAVFPNRYNNVLSITTQTEIHLFNLLDKDATQVAEIIAKQLTSKPYGKLFPVPVDLTLESQVLNRCFDDIEDIINRIQQNDLEFQRFATRWSDSEQKNKPTQQKERDKRRESELAVLKANQVQIEELMDTLQKVKLAFIIIARIRSSLQPPSITGPDYVNLLMPPLSTMLSISRQPPLSSTGFDLAKSVESPLFQKDALMFIQQSLKPNQLKFWELLGEPWNIALEEWQQEMRPYRPIFRPDNYSPYLPFLDPAVVAVPMVGVSTDTDPPAEQSGVFIKNAVYGLVGHAKSPIPDVKVEPEPFRTISMSSESHPPLEIQELDAVIAAADSLDSSPIPPRIRPYSDEEFIEKLFSEKRRVARAKARYQAMNFGELSIDENEVLEVISASTDNSLVVKNIFGETGRAPSQNFDELVNNDVSNNNSQLEQASGFDELQKIISRSASTVSTSVSSSSTNSSHSSSDDESQHIIDEATESSLVAKTILDETARAPPNNVDELANNSHQLQQTSDSKGPEDQNQKTSRSTSTSSTTVPSTNSSHSSTDKAQHGVVNNLSESKPLPVSELKPEMAESNNFSDDKSEVIELVAVTDKDDNSEVMDELDVAMRPKVVDKIPVPDKDYYDEPPNWLKPNKQKAFAAAIKKARGRVVCVIRARTALHDEEVTLHKDEILELLETPVGAWWLVRNAGDERGYVPINCLQEMEFVEPMEEIKTISKPQTQHIQVEPIVSSTTTLKQDNADQHIAATLPLQQNEPRNVESIATETLPLKQNEPHVRKSTAKKNLLASSRKQPGEEINAKVATGLLKSGKPLELPRRQKTKSERRLTRESTVEDVRRYLMQCGFSPQLVREFGSFTGEQLLGKKDLSDFERDTLQPTEIKRLFNLVQGARVLAADTSTERRGAETKTIIQ